MAPNIARLMVLHALTPIHAGTGQSTEVVDLPIQREVHTGFPMVAATGLKGSLRERAELEWGRGSDQVAVVFGPETALASDGAGALAVTDLRCLAFPVRSLQKVFVWVTCPMVLERFRRDLELAGLTHVTISAIPDLEQGEAVSVGDFQTPLVLEELFFTWKKAGEGLSQVISALGAVSSEELTTGLRERLVVVADEDFAHIVRYCTVVSARVALNSQKTTTGDGGNLWYEESLPPETVLYALALANKPRVTRDGWGDKSAEDVAQAFNSLFAARPYLQIGGNETVGHGWCRVSVTGAGDPS